MMEKKPLLRLSFCSCGHNVLDDSILLGTVYEVDLSSLRDGFSYYCGGCGRVFRNVHVVNASQILHPELPPQPLPYDLFAVTN